MPGNLLQSDTANAGLLNREDYHELHPGEKKGMSLEWRFATPFSLHGFLFTPVPERPDAVLDALWREKIDYILVGATEQNPEHLEVYDRENLKLSLLLRSLLRAGSLRLIPVPGGGDYTLLAVEKPSDGKITEK